MASVNYSYLFYFTKDYTGANALSSYTLDITPITFIPDFTSSPLLTGAIVINNKKIEWNFGDGTYSNELTASHVYKWPGSYRPKLTIFDSYGNAYDSSYKPVIQIHDFVADGLEFKNFKRFIYDVPAGRIIEPLTIQRQNSWQSYDATDGIYTINLYASGAAGSYINYESFTKDKWSHLRSLSRFYEIQVNGDKAEYVIVDKVQTKNTDIYARINNNTIEQCTKEDDNSFFAGTTGYSEFYYVDDKTKNYTTREAPILVIASFDSAKFKDAYSTYSNMETYVGYPPAGVQNLQPAVLPIIKVRHNSASRLSITTNGIDGEGSLSATNFNMPYISWQNTEIPFVIRMKDFENYTTKTYPPLSSSMIDTGMPDVSAYNLQISLVKDDTVLQSISSTQYFSDFTPAIPQSIGSFYKGFFIPQESTENVKLTAGMYIVDPVNFPKDSLVGWIAEPQYFFIKRIFKTSFYSYCEGSMQLTLSAYVNDYATPGSTESYAIAVAPSGAGFGEDYRAWVADGHADKIYKIDIFGGILSAFSLSAYPINPYDTIDLQSQELSSAAPNSISLDGNSDIWISLFDAVSAIKIDSLTGYIKAIAYPNIQNMVYALSADYTLPELSGFAGENSLLPASIDTDGENNIWVAYTHPVSNFLIKYDPNGTLLTAVPFTSLVSPVEIVVDRNKYVWLTALNLNSPSVSLTGKNDFVYKYTSTGTLVPGYPLSGFRLAGNITVDGAQNAYVSHDRETIIKIDGDNAQLSYYAAGSGLNQTNYICSIGGIACDTGNYIWTINNFDNKMYYIDSYLPTLTSMNDVDYVDLTYPQDSTTNPVSAFEERSFQSYGDWNGSRWINKYMVPYTITRYLTGESAVFNILPDQGKYNITKVNEDFDASAFYNDLRYQETLFDKNVFFNEFLGTIVGGTSAQPYELGKVVYEKIANFVSNNVDIDKCNLDQLLSFCEEISLQFEQYNYPFPPQVRRLVDILSIKHKMLWGDRNTFTGNYDKKGYTDNSKYGTNLGSQLAPDTGTITVGTPVVALETFSDGFSLVNYGIIPGYATGDTVPLSTFSEDWGWGLVAPYSVSGTDISNYYSFYEFIDTIQGSYYNNTINWSDPQTLLSPSLSSFTDWTKPDGIMQTILSYEITKGLKLFTSAVDIAYNN